MADLGEWERWLWPGVSLLLAVVAAQVFWWAERARNRPAWITRFLTWPYTPAVLLVLRLTYYLGLPAAALVWGRDAIVGRRFGLQPVAALQAWVGMAVTDGEIAANWADWARDAIWAAGLVVVTLAILTLSWWVVRNAPGVGRPAETPAYSGGVVFEAAFHETHWAFYRNAPIVALELAGVQHAVYWGAWAGLGLVALEAMSNPRWWADLAAPARACALLTRAGMAVFSVVLFLQTQNLWLAMLAHCVVTFAGQRIQEAGGRK